MYVVGAPIEEPPDFYGREELLTALLGGRDRLTFLMGLRRTVRANAWRGMGVLLTTGTTLVGSGLALQQFLFG